MGSCAQRDRVETDQVLPEAKLLLSVLTNSCLIHAPSWDAYQRAACRKAPRDYGACSNYTAITKFDAGQDDRVGADPAMLANLDGIYMFPLAKIV